MEQNTVKVIDTVADQDVDMKGDILVGRENIHNTLPPHESYEGRHRHDPLAEWTAAEERSVVRKTDLRLLSWLCIMVSFVSQVGPLCRVAYNSVSSLDCSWIEVI